MRPRLKLASLLLALALLCSACASDYERRGDTSSTLYIGEVASAFPTSYMPWFSRDGVAPTISSMVYSTLLDYDQNTDEYQPKLVKEWAYLDRSGQPLLTAEGGVDYARLEAEYAGSDTACIPVRFVLDENATWSDGERVTAADIYFTFDLAANQKLSNHAGALAWVNDLMHKYDSNTGKLRRQGIYTYATGANEKGYPIQEEEKDTVFYFEVSKVLGAITPLVSTVLVLPEHIYADIISFDNPINNTSPSEELSYAYQHPVGCGPFTLDRDRTNGQEIVLHRRDDYHIRDENGAPLYKVETLKFVLYQEINVAIYALKKGHIDVLDSSISANYAKLFTQEEDVWVASAPGLYTNCLVLNLNAPAGQSTRAREQLKNPDLRQALALAIDQQALIDFVLDGHGRTAPAGLVLEGDLYAPEADILSAPAEERLAQANALLDALYPEKDEAGYRLDAGKRLSYQILASPGEQDVVSYLQVLFQKIGVEVRYAAKGNSPETTYLYGGNFDMTLQGVTLTPSNIDIMYNAHFSNLNRSSNYGRLMDEEITQGIAAMRATLNRETKYEMIRALEEKIARQYYKLPLYCQDVTSAARTDRFTGWTVSAGENAFNLTSLSQLTQAKGR